MIQLLWETLWRFLKKLGIKLPHDPVIWVVVVISILGIYREKTIIERDTCTPMFVAHYLQRLGHGSSIPR